MKKIYLTGKNARGRYAIVDDEDYDMLMTLGSWWWKDKYACLSKIITDKKIYIRMHKLIFGDDWSFNLDHINGDTLDNRKINLRVANHSQNAANNHKRKGCSSLYKGVRRIGKRWYAQIQKNDIQHDLGIFKDEIKAAMAYDKKARELFGEFARLNFQVE